MKEREQIDWSQVIPGKTWLESPNGCQCRVVAMEGIAVWVCYKGNHFTWTKASIESYKWRIREEWVDVTHECTFDRRNVNEIIRVVVAHQGYVINLTDGNYRITASSIYKRRTL